MLIANSEVYLPLSEKTLTGLLRNTRDFVQGLQSLSLAEYSALFVLIRLPDLRRGRGVLAEQMLGSAIELGRAQVQASGLQSYIDNTHSLLDIAKIESGLDCLADFNIALLDDNTIELAEYISADGGWDYEFKQRRTQALIAQAIKVTVNKNKVSYLSAEQSRLYREFEAQNDEQSHVHGYAGTGKTFLIMAFLRMLEQSNAQVLLLAQTGNQLDSLAAKARPGANVDVRTFTNLAEQIIPQDLTTAAHNNFRRVDRSRQTVTDQQLVQLLGVRDSGGFRAAEIVGAARGTLFKFCQSDSGELSDDHLPNRYKLRFDHTLRAITCQHAQELWRLYQSPAADRSRLQVRGYHAIKWAALNNCRVPVKYTHVILDECHNLPKSMLQILNRSSQALLTLGDEYQSLKGAATLLPEQIRKRELSHSVRSSTKIESIINPIISVHPGAQKTRFHGNRSSRTDIEYYKVAKVPDQPFVILVSEMWGLFEWAQRISAGSATLQMLSNEQHLNMFVQDCIELYNTGARARHPELFRFKTWDDVERYNRHNPGFERINRMLERGFSYNDWMRTYSKFNSSGQGSLALALIEDTLNREFDNVMLTPDIFSESGKEKLAEFCSALYVGVTRAKAKLIAPETLRNWIEDIPVR